MRVNYVSEGGFIQIREVPDKADPKTYKYGILVGPPDLADLPLAKTKIKELSNALAQAGMGNYDDTRGRRDEIMEMVKRITGSKNKELLRSILYIYQKSFLEE